MNPQVFREYDIRGIVERDFDDAFVIDLGRAYATALVEAGGRRIVLGRDCRLTSARLRELFLQGLLESGVDVIDTGVVPTPLLYFAVARWGMDGGVMITGSHNPPEYNGFKLGIGHATLYGEQIQQLRRIIEERAFVKSATEGSLTEKSVVPEYREFILQSFRLKPGLRVVLDAGNGCGGAVAAPLMREMGIDLVGLFLDMDGRFPNHHPDPTVEAYMQDLVNAVISSRACVGIAYDGDADRLGAVDERGRIVWGDELIVLFSRGILKERRGATVIGDVKCSKRMYDDIERNGGRAIMWKTGHSLIKSKLKEEGAALAGEMSGHMFFADRYYGFDDAIYASFRLLEIISREGKGIASLLSDLPTACVTPEIRVDCPDEQKFQVVQEVAEFFRARHEVIDIDGVRVNFDNGWGLLRASNTQPALVMRFEGRDPESLASIRAQFEDKLKELGVI